MRMEQIKLSEEAEASKKFLADFNKIGSIIQSRSKFFKCPYNNLSWNLLHPYYLKSSLCANTPFSIVNQQADLHEDLKKKFVQGAKERKELYNKILELKG